MDRANSEEPPSLPSNTNNCRVELSIEAKREIIRSYDALPHMSQQNASKVLQVPRMTLRRMLSNRDKIMDAKYSSMKRCRVGKDAVVKDALTISHTVPEHNMKESALYKEVEGEQICGNDVQMGSSTSTPCSSRLNNIMPIRMDRGQSASKNKLVRKRSLLFSKEFCFALEGLLFCAA